MKQQIIPHIYKVTNLETHQYYIGSQCSGKKIGVNYFTSSTNKEFKNGFKTYREEKYKIEIIKEFEDPDECVRAENYMIRDHMLLKDGLCLNRSCRCNGKKIFSAVGIHHAPWNKGMPPSEETRKKMSEAHKGLPVWNKGLPAWNKGVHHSEETKQKISTSRKRKISIKNTVFDSLTEAAKYYNVVPSTISRWVKKNQHNAVYIEKCPKI